MRAVAVLLLFSSLAGCVTLRSSAHPEPNALALVGGRIIDGTGAEAVYGTVLIHGDRIVSVGSDIDVPPGFQRLDVSGMTILPGMMDLHGHMWGWQAETEEMRNWFEVYSALFLAGGVTTVFSPGEVEPEEAIAFRDRVRRGEVVAPRFLTSGPYFGHELHAQLEPDSLAALIRPWLGRVDGLKMYAGITEPQLQAVLAEAHAAGTRVVGHLGSMSTLRAIELGIDQIEHGLFTMSELLTGEERGYWEIACTLAELDLESPIVEQLVSSIADSRVAFGPTMLQWEIYLPDYPPVTPYWTRYFTAEAVAFQLHGLAAVGPKDEQVECARRAFANSREFLARVHSRGGLIVPGTDPVAAYLLPGYALHRELAIYVEAGLSPVEAIQTATLNSAIALGLEHELGSIAPGKLADLVVVRGEPDQRIDDLAEIVLVFREGRRYDPAELKRSVEGRLN